MGTVNVVSTLKGMVPATVQGLPVIKDPAFVGEEIPRGGVIRLKVELGNDEMTAGSESRTQHREFVIFMAQIFTPRGAGEGLRLAAADEIVAIFRNNCVPVEDGSLILRSRRMSEFQDPEDRALDGMTLFMTLEREARYDR